MHKFLCGHKFSVYLGNHPAERLLDYGYEYLGFIERSQAIFQSVGVLFHFQKLRLKLAVVLHVHLFGCFLLNVLFLCKWCAVVAHCNLKFPNNMIINIFSCNCHFSHLKNWLVFTVEGFWRAGMYFEYDSSITCLLLQIFSFCLWPVFPFF